MSDIDREIAELLIEQCRHRLFAESLPRLRKCLAQLSEEEVWFRPNAETVSVGNLVLHLCGNVGQWVVSAFGQQPDHRRRDEEFAERGPLSHVELERRLDSCMQEVAAVLDGLSAADLTKVFDVQGFRETGVSILVHVVEHFSYHVGQITYYVKSRKGIDLKYYGDIDLNRTRGNSTESK
jgi:uncharacterized damage-inducible protein DinB